MVYSRLKKNFTNYKNIICILEKGRLSRKIIAKATLHYENE